MPNIIPNQTKAYIRSVHKGTPVLIPIVAWLQDTDTKDCSGSEENDRVKLIPPVFSSYLGFAITISRFFTDEKTGYSQVEIESIEFHL